MTRLGMGMEQIDQATGRSDRVAALAREYAALGVTTGTHLPQPPRRPDAARPDAARPGVDAPGPQRRIEYVDETPRRARRTDLEIAVETSLGHHYVTLLSIERPAPRFFGDNRGMLPMWVEANSDWRRSGTSFDQQQPSLRAVRLAVLCVRSEKHATRLKAALDEALHGRETADDADTLRHRFRNGVDFGDLDVWWTPLLQDALMACEKMAHNFEVFTRAEHEAMVAERVAARGGGRG